MNSITDLEARLQKILEGHLLELLPGHKPEDHLAQRLATAMHGNIKLQADGTSQAPNMYVIVAHPATLASWHANPEQLEILAEALRVTGEEAGLVFSIRPKLSTATDTNQPVGKMNIVATFRNEGVADTQDMPTNLPIPTGSETIPSNAFLILQGTKVVPLTQAVVNIGRRLDNQVVLDDPRVSRHHAQMRVIKGRFVIFDLGSTGGLFVNGQRANQSILYPGDVISLAGVTLIFGQDIPAVRRSENVKPAPSVSADRPTAILPLDRDKKE
jgi:hypothetical protein